MSYTELHSRSAFSFLRGASHPEELAYRAAELGLPAVALCDRNGFYGSVRFHKAMEEVGLKAIVGTELVMSDGTVVPVLIRNRTGYENLSRLITQAQLRSEKGAAQIHWAELAAHAEGLVALSGDEEGPLRRAWQHGGKAAMAQSLQPLKEAFPEPGSLYLELQRHRLRGEERWNRCLVDLAQHHGIPLVATNGVCYARRNGRRLQDVFSCLREHTHIDARNAGRILSLNTERELKLGLTMKQLFADLPEAITNTRVIAEQIEFSMENLGYEFPRYPVPQGETMDSFLAKITWFGAEQRYGSLTPPVRNQLERELQLIIQLGFSGYFLIVWDLVNFCRQNRVMVQGRGSAANSAVCYSLGITPVDPVGSKLLFERFLSEGRKTWPDIDLDLPSGDRRESVIQEVYRRYGRLGAAMTANVITYRGRSAVREIGKVLQFPDDVISRLSDLFARGDYPHTLEFQEQLAQAGVRPDHPRAATFITLYRQIRGLPRHLGQHSGGMIICQGRLDSVVPLENASMPNRTVAQWDKEDCADMGIVKVDLLGLGMMAVLQDAVEMTQERGHPVDLAQIPKDDKATYDLLCEADTIGVFQVESRAQMATLPRLKPRTFYDVAVEVAIVRPGPIVGQLAHPYLERRAGREPVTYMHPQVRPVLERTLGVPLFQEQVLKMAMILADFSGAEAEELRRALGFTRNEARMQRVQAKLRQAMKERGHTPEVIEQMVGSISSFALYGFPESHAISFGLLAYASAYLKVHYPAEFYTGLLNNQPMGFYSSATLIQDAKRRGLRFWPPCVNASEWRCLIVDDRTIRLGLCNVQGLSEKGARHLLEQREQQPFRSIRDFLRRTRLDADERRVLASTGALNALCSDRRHALWAVEEELREADLFDQLEQPELMVADGDAQQEYGLLSPLQLMTELERLEADYQGLGLTVGRHPMAHLRPHLPPFIRSAADLKSLRHGSRVTVAGAVICRQRPGTAKGVVFISLEDETGVSNSIVYPQLFERLRLVITQEPYLKITGDLQNVDHVIHVKARRIEALDLNQLPAGASHDFH